MCMRLCMPLIRECVAGSQPAWLDRVRHYTDLTSSTAYISRPLLQ